MIGGLAPRFKGDKKMPEPPLGSGPVRSAKAWGVAMGCARRRMVQVSRDPAAHAEDVMDTRKQWSDLSPRTRRLLTVTAGIEGILKLVALIDLKRRPASQIRGPKWLWATAVAVISSAGVLPISYFVFGRRQPRSQPD